MANLAKFQRIITADYQKARLGRVIDNKSIDTRIITLERNENSITLWFNDSNGGHPMTKEIFAKVDGLNFVDCDYYFLLILRYR